MFGSQELDRHGVEKAALIASVPGDGESVMAAVRQHPERFYGYMMVNPAAPEAAAQVEAALASGHLHALCFFPAMHRYSIQDDRATALLELLAAHPRTAAFVHCGVLQRRCSQSARPSLAVRHEVLQSRSICMRWRFASRNFDS